MAALIVTFIVACAALAAFAFVVYQLVSLRRDLAPGPSLAGRTIEIHTMRPDDQTIRGVLVAQHADRWSFTEALYRHKSGDQPIKDPLVHVPTTNIAWVSEPEGRPERSRRGEPTTRTRVRRPVQEPRPEPPRWPA